MHLQIMLRLKITQNKETNFYNCGVSQAKEDVMYITYPVSQSFAESMSSNLQLQKKFMCKTRIAQPKYRHCSRNRIIQKTKYSNAFN